MDVYGLILLHLLLFICPLFLYFLLGLIVYLLCFSLFGTYFISIHSLYKKAMVNQPIHGHGA